MSARPMRGTVMAGRPSHGRVAVIVLAAGAGVRMMAPVNKVFLRLGGTPILQRTLEGFAVMAEVDELVTVAAPADRALCDELVGGGRVAKPHRFVDGGPTRHASEHNGLLALADEIDAGRIGVVLVHDAVRPFVDRREVAELIATARRVGAALPMVPGGGRLVTVDGTRRVRAAEAGLWLAQTPQAFDARVVLEAHRCAAADGFLGTDTASVVERTGHAVAMVVGRRENIKITTADDMVLAELIAEAGPDGERVATG